MDYAKAKALIAEYAPDLAVGPDTGMNHINIYKRFDEQGEPEGPPFSIMLPESDEIIAERAIKTARESFEQAVRSAKAHLS